MKKSHFISMLVVTSALAGGCASFSEPEPVTPIGIAEAKVDRIAERLQNAESDLQKFRKDVRDAARDVEKAEDRLSRARRDEEKAERQVTEAQRDFNAARIGLGETLEDEGVPGSGAS